MDVERQFAEYLASVDPRFTPARTLKRVQGNKKVKNIFDSLLKCVLSLGPTDTDLSVRRG